MKLLDRLSMVGARKHLARSTIECYRNWVRQFLCFHRASNGSWRMPCDLRGPELSSFLTHLAVDRRCSASSQNQAVCAIMFLYQHVLENVIPQSHLSGHATSSLSGIRSWAFG